MGSERRRPIRKAVYSKELDRLNKLVTRDIEKLQRNIDEQVEAKLALQSVRNRLLSLLGLRANSTSTSRKINIHEDYEVAYWTEKFKVTKNQLEAAVKQVGTEVEKVKQHLGR